MWSGVEAAEVATGEAMATGEVIIAGELMATGGTELQSVQAMLDGGIVASTLFRTVAGHLASSSLVMFYISCLRVGL